jgi:hypothetical protein
MTVSTGSMKAEFKFISGSLMSSDNYLAMFSRIFSFSSGVFSWFGFFPYGYLLF